MTTDDRIYDLVAEWDQRRQQGNEVSAEAICQDCPELIPAVEKGIESIRATDKFLDLSGDEEEDFLSLPSFLAEKLNAGYAMPPCLTLQQFREKCLESGLLETKQLELLAAADAEELAAKLIDAKALTPYQVRQLCDGNGKNLVLGNYLILDKIGEGGMGQVFKARHRRMNRLVALKILPEKALQSKNAAQRFHREVQAAARLEHPNIVTAYDADECSGTHFLVMQYVRGSDLSSLVKRKGRLPLGKAVNCILQAAKGLEYAHGEGIIHRDIKPANLLLDPKGRLRILDMGLAKLEQADPEGLGATRAELTQDGSTMGTVDYMAPEQALDTKGADARADIYSLGCTLYYLLAGKPIYGGSSLMAKMLAHRESAIPALSEEREDVPPELTTLFEKMVAKKPEERHASMAEAAAELEAVAGQYEAQWRQYEDTVGAADVDTNEDLKARETSSSDIGDTLTVSPEIQPLAPVPLATVPAGRKAAPKKGLLIGGGLLGLALLLGVIVITITNKDGSTTKIEVPEGATVKVEEQGEEAGKLVASENDPPSANGFALQFDGKSNWAKLPFFGELRETGTIEWTMSVPWVTGSHGTETRWQHCLHFVAKDFDLDFHVKRLPGQADAIYLGSATNYVRVFHQSPKACQMAIVIEKNKASLFKNGRRQGSIPISKPFAFHNTPGVAANGGGYFFLGRDYYDGGYFEGAIDEVRISNIPRYKVNYRPEARLESDEHTLALYHFDEGQGDVLKDSSGNARHGKIFGAKWVKGVVPPQYPKDPPEAEQQAFVDAVAKLKPEEQVEAVRQKLIEANPGFDGQIKHEVKWDRVYRFTVNSDHLRTIWPVRALQRLTILDAAAMRKTDVYDLTPLKNLPLEHLYISNTSINDLSPLQGMQLKTFYCRYGAIDDLSPLAGMPLYSVNLLGCPVSDLSPLRGAPLNDLAVSESKVSDLSPLAGMPLTRLECFHTSISDLSPLAGMPLTRLECHVTNISDLSPLKGMPLTRLNCSETKVADLSPLQGMPLQDLFVTRTGVSDLLPLQGMPLELLSCSGTNVFDLSPLKEMPLRRLGCEHTLVSDLSPLAEMPLETLRSSVRLFDPAEEKLLRSLPLQQLDFEPWPKATPAAEQFWKEFEARRQAAIEFAEETAKLPAAQQGEAVLERLKVRNPKEGTEAVSLIALEKETENEAVTSVRLTLGENDDDLTPLRTFRQLRELQLAGGQVARPFSPQYLSAGKADLRPLDCSQESSHSSGYAVAQND